MTKGAKIKGLNLKTTLIHKISAGCICQGAQQIWPCLEVFKKL